jgi:hypothetical protein
MKFEFEISDEFIQKLIKGIVLAEFNADGFHKGEGYEALKGQIRSHVAKMSADFGPMIETVIQKMTPGIVEEVCSTILREKIAKVAKDMKKTGKLPLFKDGEQA